MTTLLETRSHRRHPVVARQVQKRRFCFCRSNYARSNMFRRSGRLKWIGAVALFAALIAAAPRAQNQTLTGRAAFGGWRDDSPGRRRLIRPDDLPTISSSVPASAEVVPRPANSAHAETEDEMAGRSSGRIRRLRPGLSSRQPPKAALPVNVWFCARGAAAIKAANNATAPIHFRRPLRRNILLLA